MSTLKQRVVIEVKKNCIENSINIGEYAVIKVFFR